MTWIVIATLALCLPSLRHLRGTSLRAGALVAGTRSYRDETTWVTHQRGMSVIARRSGIVCCVLGATALLFLSTAPPVYADTPLPLDPGPGGLNSGTGMDSFGDLGGLDSMGSGGAPLGVDTTQGIATLIQAGAIPMGTANEMLSASAPTQMFDPTFGSMNSTAMDSVGPMALFTPLMSSPATTMAVGASPVAAIAEALTQQSIQENIRMIQDQERLQQMMMQQMMELMNAAGCPSSAPDTHMPGDIDIFDLCSRSVRQARSPAAAAAIKYALNQVGSPYCRSDRPENCDGDGNRFGQGPAGGYDCSGLVTKAYEDGGIDFGAANWTGAMPQASWAILLGDPDEMMPGDLFVRKSSGDEVGHVSMKLVDGLIVHASTWDKGVRLDYVTPSSYEYYIVVEAV